MSRGLALGLVLLAGCGAAAHSKLSVHAPAPATCHLRGKGLMVVPDPRCNRATWIDKDGSGVCSSGYNPRPPASVTGPIKREVMRAYGLPLSLLRSYELDHIAPRWLGGATVQANLFPEPNYPPSQQTQFVHNPKDQLEGDLFERVCFKHSMTVAEARKVFEHDWRKGYRRYEK